MANNSNDINMFAFDKSYGNSFDNVENVAALPFEIDLFGKKFFFFQMNLYFEFFVLQTLMGTTTLVSFWLIWLMSMGVFHQG